MTQVTFEIVEVKGRKYAQVEDTKETRTFLKELRNIAGGDIYKNEGKIVYRGIGANGNLTEWYKSVFQNYGWIITK